MTLISAQVYLFYGFAGLAVLGALGSWLLVRNAMAAVMSLIVTVVSLSVLYVLMGAHAVAALQLLIQAGTALVLLLFVLLLVNPDPGGFGTRDPGQVVIQIIGAAAALAVGFVIAGTVSVTLPLPAEAAPGSGGFRELGVQLVTVYAVPVEAVGLLLLAAVVGAVVQTRQEGR